MTSLKIYQIHLGSFFNPLTCCESDWYWTLMTWSNKITTFQEEHGPKVQMLGSWYNTGKCGIESTPELAFEAAFKAYKETLLSDSNLQVLKYNLTEADEEWFLFFKETHCRLFAPDFKEQVKIRDISRHVR